MKKIKLIGLLGAIGIVAAFWWSNSIHTEEIKEENLEVVSEDISNATEDQIVKIEDDNNPLDTLSIWEINNPEIPKKVLEVLLYVRHNKKTPEGYRGYEVFQNRERLLPQKDENGHKINYIKFDVNPWIRGVNRGAERLVTSKDKSYYTADHYRSFNEIDEKL
jgi:guanyl-specific ribonuclease Sa